MRNSCVALLLLGCGLSAGCVSYEGLGISSVAYINPHIQEYHTLPGVTEYGDDEEERAKRTDLTRVIAIGTVSVLREFEPDEYEKEYARYVEDFEGWGVDREPSVSFAEFSESIAGWSRIKGFHIPLLGGMYMSVLVPKSIMSEVEFESGVAVVMLSTSSDLVAAENNDDGAFLLTKMLCRDKKGYHACKKEYHRGVFDAATGKELDGKSRFKEGGYRIDPATYKVIEPEQ